MRDLDVIRNFRFRFAGVLLLLICGLWTASYWRILIFAPDDNMVFLDHGYVS